ncbi:MAG: hypothetical protein HQK83_00325 [Fibrobacteria bacterium]|nr:hypothetical protein [Fibrobacteria bacterium]
MTKLIFPVFISLLILSGIGYSFEIKKISQPTISFGSGTGLTTAQQTLVKAAIEPTLGGYLDSTIGKANTALSGFSNQQDLAQGFANANTFSSHSGTFAGYQNYKLFAVGGGFMIGVQAPSLNLSYYSKIADEINSEGDLYAGVGVSTTFLNVGINAGFLVPGLYLNAKWGGTGFEVADFKYDFQVMGIGANYRLLDSKSLVGLIKWRGISIGTGVYYQSNTIEYTVSTDPVYQDLPLGDLISAQVGTTAASGLGFNGTSETQMALTPEFTMGLDVATTTIPIDAVTSLSVLFGVLNIYGGVGFDINFGSCEIGLSGTSMVNTDTPDSTKMTITEAEVEFDGLSDNSPVFARPRFITGVGFGIGPVKLDIPIIYYPTAGLAFGVSGIVAW